MKTTPVSPPSGPAIGSFNGLHRESNFLAIQNSTTMQTSTTITPRSFRGLPLLLGLAALGFAMPAAKVQATMIYQDDFIGGTVGTDLKNSVPDVRLGSYGGSASATWSATTGDWLFNGAGVSSTRNDKSIASLPFTPWASTVYTLTWTWTQQTAGNWWMVVLSPSRAFPWGTVGPNASNVNTNGIAGLNTLSTVITTDATTGYSAVTTFNGTTAAPVTGLRASITAVGFITQANAAARAMTSMSLSVAVPPATPTGLGAVAAPGQVVLTWTAADGATGYKVKRSTSVSGPPYPDEFVTSAPNYTDTAVTNGTTYYYVVSATNDVGESTNSDEVSATPTAAKANQTITFTLGTSVNKTVIAAPFADTATATSTLPVTYSSDNTSVATVDANTGMVTITGLGTAHILADQAGDASFNPAPQATQTLTVTKAFRITRKLPMLFAIVASSLSRQMSTIFRTVAFR